MSTVQVKTLMSEMKLAGMIKALEKTMADATQDSWSYSEFIDVLLQAESDYREEKKSQSRIKASKLRIRASFEDFDFTANRSITKTQIKEIYSLKWVEQGRPLLIIGQTGVGKTFIAQAAGLHACVHKKSVLFMSVSTWLESVALARSTGGYIKFRDKLSKPDVLILDFGMRKFSDLEAQDLCEILEERSAGKSTIVTTQLPLDHWQEVLPDPVIGDAILDRLKHAALQFKITGESYRSVKAKKLDAKAEGK
ncbi:MAG: IS21-like element helper ATPase IstB [Bdellovibrionia bacterium]